MKKKTLKANIIFILGTIIFLLGFLFCIIFRFRFLFFEIIMLVGVLVETYGLFFMGKKLKRKKKETKKKKEEVI